MRQWLTRMFVVLFALSYSAAAVAAHCQPPASMVEPVQAYHDHQHDGQPEHHHHPAPVDDGCAAMEWEQVLAPVASTSFGLAPPQARLVPTALPPVSFATDPSRPFAPPRPPPDTPPHVYADAFKRTGRLII